MKENGGSAFPVVIHYIGPLGEQRTNVADGISARDYFAATALPTLIAADSPDLRGATPDELLETWAKAAYAIADAMIAERSKE